MIQMNAEYYEKQSERTCFKDERICLADQIHQTYI